MVELRFGDTALLSAPSSPAMGNTLRGYAGRTTSGGTWPSRTADLDPRDQAGDVCVEPLA